MKRILKRVLLLAIIVLITGIWNKTKSQDSLLQLLSKSKNKVEILLKLAENRIPDSIGRANFYLNKAFKIAKKEDLERNNSQLYYLKGKINFKRGKLKDIDSILLISLKYAMEKKNHKLLSKINYLLGDINYQKSFIRPSKDYYNKAYLLAIKIGDSLLQADILIDQSYNFSITGENDTALIILKKANQISKQLDFKKGIGKISTAIGNIYNSLKDFELALSYYRTSFYYAKEIGNLKGQGVSLQNIGICHASLGRLQEAIDTLNLSTIYLKKSNNIGLLSSVYRDLANIFADLGEFDRAYENLTKVITFYKANNDLYNLGITYHVYSAVYFMDKNIRESNIYLDSCLTIAKKINFKLLEQRAYSSYVRNYKVIDDFKNAYHYLEKSNVLKDSIQNQQMKQQLMDFEAKYKTLEKEKEIEVLEKDKKLDKLNLKRRQWERNASILAFLLVLILISILIQRRKKERQLAKIKNEKNLLQKQELEQKLDFQSKQLTTHALNMLQKNKLLQSLQEDIKGVSTKAKQEIRPELKSLVQKINISLKGEKDWELFRMYFEQVNKDFFHRITSKYAKLTSGDLRLIALLKLNLNTKEIASILNLSPDSIKNARHRLRKKLQLKPENELFEFISRF